MTPCRGSMAMTSDPSPLTFHSNLHIHVNIETYVLVYTCVNVPQILHAESSIFHTRHS